MGVPHAVPWMPGILDDEPADGGAAPVESVSEFERGLEEGHARGRAEGLAEGRRIEQQTLIGLRSTLVAIIEDLDARQEDWVETLEQNLAALAVGIARQLLGRELEGNREAIALMVRRAVSQFAVGQPVTVRLHPEDLTLLLSVGDEEESTAPDDTRWIADPRIEPGGCVVEGPDRVIDGRLDRALERVYRSLTDE